MSSFVLIEGKVQPYQWGGFDFIPNLLSQEGTSGTPSAEYWLGCHPSAPSAVKSDGTPINDYLQTQSAPSLQFLFKILDVKEMLSIQSHPTKEQAKEGFERENKLAIPLDAKNRNYKDECDKPELMVALSTFWLLHGIKKIEIIEKSLSEKEYLKPLLTVLQRQGLTAAFQFALSLEDEAIINIHKSLVDDFNLNSNNYSKNNIDHWIHSWIQLNPTTVNGILTLYFLNLVKLETGEAIYQPPGLLHAYLEGQNVELMANSDNVLRAGLTPKHIDVNELLNTCNLNSSNPADYVIQQKTLPNSAVEYTTPFQAFELEEFNSSRSNTVEWTTNSTELLFCYQGTATVKNTQGTEQKLVKGEALLILPNSQLKAQLSQAILFKAKNAQL